MTLDPAIAAAERTAAVQHLFEQAQAGFVGLVTLSALELCVLDGPGTPCSTSAWHMPGRGQGTGGGARLRKK